MQQWELQGHNVCMSCAHECVYTHIHTYDWIREKIDQYRGYPPTGFK